MIAAVEASVRAWFLRSVGFVFAALSFGCASDAARPPIAPANGAPSADGPAPPLTKEEHEALERELGFGVARALDGHLPRVASIHAPKRSVSKEVTTIDYDAIPILDGKNARPDEKAALAFTRRRDVTETCSEGYGLERWFVPPSAPFLGASAHLRVAGAHVALVGRELIDDGGVLATSVTLKKPVAFEWTTVDEAKRERDRVPIAHADGTFDGSRLVARIDRAGTVDAMAIVPGLVYAFRRCDAHCDAPLTDRDRVEEVTIVGPPALWVGTSASSERQSTADDGAYSDVSASVRPGSSMSLSMLVSRERVAAFRKSDDKSDKSASDDKWIARPESFSLEVVWPVGEAPSATFFRGALGALDQDVEGPRVAPPSANCLPL